MNFTMLARITGSFVFPKMTLSDGLDYGLPFSSSYLPATYLPRPGLEMIMQAKQACLNVQAATSNKVRRKK